MNKIYFIKLATKLQYTNNLYGVLNKRKSK